MSSLNRLFKGKKDWLFLLALLPFFVFLIFNLTTGVLAQSGQQQLFGYAWSPNIGWTQLHGDGANVIVEQDGNITGYAWNAHLGWLDFNPSDPYSGEPQNSAKIEGDSITGWARFCTVFEEGCSGSLKPDSARGGWDGWVKMEDVILGTPQTSASGHSYQEIEGYAWGGNEFVGWIDLAPEIETDTEPCTPEYVGPPVVCGVEEPEFEVSCSMSPLNISAGDVSTGSSIVSGGDGSYTYEWFTNRDNTSFLPIEGSDASEMDITFTQNGNYQVRLIVQDGSGASGMASCGNVEVSGEWDPYRALCDGPTMLNTNQDGDYEGGWEFIDELNEAQRQSLESDFTFRWYDENWNLVESDTTNITRNYSQEGDYENRFVIYHPGYTATDASCGVNVGEGLQVSCKASVASGDGICTDDKTCFIETSKNVEFEIDTNIENPSLNYWKQNIDLAQDQLSDPTWLEVSSPFTQTYNYSQSHEDDYSIGVMYRMYVAAGFSGDPTEEPQDYCSVTVFDFTPKVLTINKTGNGSVRVKNTDGDLLYTCNQNTCKYGLPEGSEIILEPSPVASHLSWGDNCSDIQEGDDCNLIMDDNKVVSAVFSTDPPPGNPTSCSSSEDVIVVGQPAVFTASAGGGKPYTWEVKKTSDTSWTTISAGNVIISGTIYATAFLANDQLILTFNPDAAGETFNLQVTGSDSNAIPGACEPIEPEITLTINIVGNGTVTNNDDINCISDCIIRNIAKDIEINLSAIPNEDWSFSSWAGCDTEDSCNVIMNTSKTVTATFESEPLTPTVEFNIAPSARVINCTPSATSFGGTTNCFIGNPVPTGDFRTLPESSPMRRFEFTITEGEFIDLGVDFYEDGNPLNWGVFRWYNESGTEITKPTLSGTYSFIIEGPILYQKSGKSIEVRITIDDEDSYSDYVNYTNSASQPI